ncbi:Avirulence induced gene (AIG1) family protein [Striga hermonthica]|uniref:Avirulence induced gene (AIG1) family protein n=1 Tax=Striga hermonthica TaxID=68872 RepID=A0A9N7R2C7_STRHE|nr:Avirulence induced gene (AIG1) family protein [Striga hermonthica]
MGGSENSVYTIVLLGKTGNGKSSTGNSLLGKRAFKSNANFGGGTTACELQTAELESGLILNIIDTPGLCDISGGDEKFVKEVVKCIDMAKNRINAVVLVLSARFRFSQEEKYAIWSLFEIFGGKITDYMILLFTGGDDLAENEETLDDYLGRDCPEPLKIESTNMSEVTRKLEQQVAEEREARLRAEVAAKDAYKRSTEEFREMSYALEMANKRLEKLRTETRKINTCPIL